MTKIYPCFKNDVLTTFNDADEKTQNNVLTYIRTRDPMGYISGMQGAASIAKESTFRAYWMWKTTGSNAHHGITTILAPGPIIALVGGTLSLIIAFPMLIITFL